MNKKKTFLKGACCGALVVILICSLASCGVVRNAVSLVGKNVVSSDAQKKLKSLKSLIDSYYLNDVDESALTEGMYKGYIDGLDDPYSVYYDEEETKELTESTSGEYVGIGAVLTESTETGIVTITHVYSDSPAQKGGMKDGDILYKVEGEEVTGEDLSDIVSKIKGEKGTEVSVTVLRGEKQEEKELTMTRDSIEVETVEYRMLDDSIGYLAVSEFDTVTYDQYIEALDALQAQDMQRLIVDLRGNPGGNLDTVCNILDQMLPEGLIVYTEYKDGEKQEISSDEENQFTKPLAVLVNGNSASASEIYAGAIQDYGIGTIVGEQTYGKGVVQQIFDLGDDTCVKLTVAEYYTPNGRNINGTGITPDVEVEYEANEQDEDADNQLDAAVEEVKKQIEN